MAKTGPVMNLAPSLARNASTGTDAPRAGKALTGPAPMPLAPPVTMIRRPSRSTHAIFSPSSPHAQAADDPSAVPASQAFSPVLLCYSTQMSSPLLEDGPAVTGGAVMAEFQPGAYVARRGDSAAVIMADSGITVTYRELDERSQRLAQLLRAGGLEPGDHLAVLLENHPRYFEVFWGAQRAGLYTTPINWHLKPEEAGYIVEDCGATALITSSALSHLATDLEPHLGTVAIRLIMD